MNNQEEIYQRIVLVLNDLFEIDPQQVSLQSRLYEELDIDSIGALSRLLNFEK